MVNQGGPSRQNGLIIVYGYRGAITFNQVGPSGAILIVGIGVGGLFMDGGVRYGGLAEGVGDE